MNNPAEKIVTSQKIAVSYFSETAKVTFRKCETSKNKNRTQTNCKVYEEVIQSLDFYL